MGRARDSRLPGFRLTLGFTVFYLCLLVLLPLAFLVAKAASGGWLGFWHAVSSPRAVASLRFTFLTSLAAAALNFQSLALHGGKMGAACDEADIGAGLGQRRAESASNAPGADNRNTHGVFLH